MSIRSNRPGGVSEMKKETLGGHRGHSFHRRDLMKVGTGAVVAAMQVPAWAEDTPDRLAATTGAPPVAHAPAPDARSSGNGQMDDTTRTLVSYVQAFSE